MNDKLHHRSLDSVIKYNLLPTANIPMKRGLKTSSKLENGAEIRDVPVKD